MAGRPEERGLTLVELVAIVGFVGIIAAILFPLFTRNGVISDHRSPCLSGLKQISLALIMYSTDSDDVLPPASTWADRTMPYSKNADIYKCPDLKLATKQFGHAYNRGLENKTTASFAYPTNVPATFDATDLSWNANGPLSLLPQPGRHPDGRNTIAFLDAHAKPMTRMELFHRMSGPQP